MEMSANFCGKCPEMLTEFRLNDIINSIIYSGLPEAIVILYKIRR